MSNFSDRSLLTEFAPLCGQSGKKILTIQKVAKNYGREEQKLFRQAKGYIKNPFDILIYYLDILIGLDANLNKVTNEVNSNFSKNLLG